MKPAAALYAHVEAIPAVAYDARVEAVEGLALVMAPPHPAVLKGILAEHRAGERQRLRVTHTHAHAGTHARRERARVSK